VNQFNQNYGINLIDAYIDTIYLPEVVSIPADEYRLPDQFCTLQGDFSWGILNGNLSTEWNPLFMKYFTGNISAAASAGYCFQGLVPGRYQLEINGLLVQEIPDIVVVLIKTDWEEKSMQLHFREKNFQSGFLELEINASNVLINLSSIKNSLGMRYIRLQRL